MANSLRQQRCSGRSSVVNGVPTIMDNLACSMCDAQVETFGALLTIIWSSIWAHSYRESVVESSLNVMEKWSRRGDELG